ncbi:MAG: hypothetical protein WD136_05050 [Cyanobium sp.]
MQPESRKSEPDSTIDPVVIPPSPKWQPPAASVLSWQQQRERQDELEQELAKTREEVQAMQALLEDLPALFEDKFSQRLQPMLEQQQRLLEDNASLRQHLVQLQPGSEPPRQRLLMPRKEDRPRIRQALLHAFGFNSRIN